MKLSFVTLVNHPEIYNENVIKSTFEYKHLINYIQIYNAKSASEGLNRGIAAAENDLILCCHQDIQFLTNWYEQLTKTLNLLEEHDKDWGVCGFAGTTFKGQMVGTHSGLGMNNKSYILSQTLDCSTLLLQKHIMMKYRLKFDENLSYFHAYGEDISLQAIHKDLGVYTLNVPIQHNTKWTAGKGFGESFDYLKSKWKSIFPTIYTTVGQF